VLIVRAGVMGGRTREWLAGVALEFVRDVFNYDAALYTIEIFDSDLVSVRAGFLMGARHQQVFRKLA
jgi:hypothetical protein